MNAFTRRQALVGASLAAVAAGSFAVSGCSSTDLATLQKITTEAQAIVQGLGAALKTMAATIPAATQTEIQNDIAMVSAAADAISKAASLAAAQSPVNQILTYVGTIGAFLPTLGLPAAAAQMVAEIFAAIQVLIPAIAAAVGAPAPASASRSAMTEAQATVFLLSKH